MKIITIATQKGGAGKTTLATNLSIASAKANFLTLLIDADSQQTALEWFNKRDNKNNPLTVSATNLNRLEQLINAAKNNKIERIFIDTQGANNELVNFAIKKADFCLIPCSAGGFDVTAQRITAAIVLQEKKQAAFIITKVNNRSNELAETKSILSGLGLQITDCKTTLLKVYKEAALSSFSVLETEHNSKAAQEITGLFNWLETKLKDNQLLDKLNNQD